MSTKSMEVEIEDPKKEYIESKISDDEIVACISVSDNSLQYLEYHKPENIGRTTKRNFDVKNLSKKEAEKRQYTPCKYCFPEIQ